jgi:N-lysine methyltransferase SETD6
VFVIGTDCEVPPELVSLARLLLQPKVDWEKTKSKGKLPKPAMDATVAAIATDVLQRRLKEYRTSAEVSCVISNVLLLFKNYVQEDEQRLAGPEQLNPNLKMAMTVRLGEKRILAGTLKVLQGQYEKDANKRKRGKIDGSDNKGKKARR